MAFRRLVENAFRQAGRQNSLKSSALEFSIKLFCTAEEVGNYICVSAPQCPLSTRYVEWLATIDSREVVPVILHSLDAWNRDHGGEKGYAEWLKDFGKFHRPQLIWERVFCREQVDNPQPTVAERTEFENIADSFHPLLQKAGASPVFFAKIIDDLKNRRGTAAFLISVSRLMEWSIFVERTVEQLEAQGVGDPQLYKDKQKWSIAVAYGLVESTKGPGYGGVSWCLACALPTGNCCDDCAGAICSKCEEKCPGCLFGQ